MGRDKFAAMARAAESTEPSAVPHVAANPPRRDKMAALAASQATTTSSASGGSRGNSKLAAMAAASGAAVAPEATSSDGLKTLHAAKLKSRMSKRRQILENLDLAEDLTCKLLELVHKTTTALQDLSSNSSDLPHLSREYRKTLNEIHPLLSTGAEDLVRPYKNHSTETNQSMYAARVEMRLAKERTDVIKVLTELEQEQPASGQFESLSSSPAVGTTTNKRPREE
eukprot:scaffold6265_cov193-Cylindrotheca_fusiformis.AAC.12